ncbi:hypothetical protein CAP35_03085 [Chitinophagaceae bacterium IBVUCB1]|nr:hypothetical protein CAP35_03085 [Chitinophagaceae bacterium IBVUCB1]
MSIEERNNKPTGYDKLKAYRHIVMGIMYLCFAVVMFYLKQFGAIELSAAVAYSLGGLLVVYGVFRIWRGIADAKAMSGK